MPAPRGRAATTDRPIGLPVFLFADDRSVVMAGGRDVLPDFEDLCASFNRHQVDYLIVGSEAVAVHGCPRYSQDFDISVEPSVANARRVFAALGDFGFASALSEHSPEAWISSRQTLELGVKPNQVHILLELSGVTYEETVRNPMPGKYGDTPVRFIGYDALIRNKKAAARAKDLADVQALESARTRTPSDDAERSDETT